MYMPEVFASHLKTTFANHHRILRQAGGVLLCGTLHSGVTEKIGTGASSTPKEFEHCSEWQELKACISENAFVKVKVSSL